MSHSTINNSLHYTTLLYAPQIDIKATRRNNIKPKEVESAHFTFADLLYFATEGDVAAQYNLGVRLDNAVGVPQNLSEAFHWYAVAAENGHINAQFNVGCCYCDGVGVAQNNIKAAKWLRIAAKAGHTGAQCNLGWCYEHGIGVKRRDFAKARKLYEAAAAQGHVHAQYNLGACWLHGHGTEADIPTAVLWYERAAAQGSAPAQQMLEQLRASETPQGRGDWGALTSHWRHLSSSTPDHSPVESNPHHTRAASIGSHSIRFLEDSPLQQSVDSSRGAQMEDSQLQQSVDSSRGAQWSLWNRLEPTEAGTGAGTGAEAGSRTGAGARTENHGETFGHREDLHQT